MPDEAIPWGQRVRDRRVELEMSVEDFATAVDVHIATVYRWEASENAPHRDTMQKIADVLQSDPCGLFFREQCEAA